ncbi:epidermal growth factor receptor kinase [Echinococcus multilocularis]|uniref:Epidermal growth factor receptor kinase n=1 Tax=Echinococcus multilocularis TaxID=6211 RepID=A0A087VYW7_ECHMU|nr:epidermal growth factor receptor kinase [Echinococcus multilocularis]
MKKRMGGKKKSDSHARRTPQPSKPEIEEFFESVHERMKSLAIAQKSYRARNDKELSVQPGEFFEVLDDVGSWWCLRAPSGRTGHVPKTHLEIIPNPAKEAERFNDQPIDPIVVKVPVIVKASVQHQEVEEQVKSSAPKKPVTPLPTIPPSESTPPPKKSESPVPAQSEQKVAPVPPPQPIFPPPMSYHDRPPYHTVVKEVIREVQPHRHYCRAKSRHQSKRDTSPVYSDRSGSSCTSKTSSSSGVASWISDGGYERTFQRQQPPSRHRRPKPQPRQQRSTHRSVPQPSKPPEASTPSHPSGQCCHSGARNSNCRYRSVCCYSSAHSRARSSITEMSHRGSSKKEQSQQLQQPQQPQQPMIILLEAPKQEAPQPAQMAEEQSADDYYDPNSQPQISIVLPPNAQVTPQLSAYTQLQQPQYAQAPMYYNWSPQYYQGYA